MPRRSAVAFPVFFAPIADTGPGAPAEGTARLAVALVEGGP